MCRKKQGGLSLSRIVVDEFHENLETALYLQELKDAWHFRFRIHSLFLDFAKFLTYTTIYFAKWFCAPGVQPVRQRPCVDCFHGPMFFCFAEDSETMLWGLTGTPCLDDFANVAKLVRACSDIDLLVFRRQLDAKDLVTWKNVFGRFASGVLSHFRWVWEHLGNFCTSFDVICSEATVFCLLCATWSYNHFRRNELWTTWHVPMAIWRVWRHLNSRPFDRLMWFVWFVWFPNRITQDAKSVDFIKKSSPPPPPQKKKIQTWTEWNDEKLQTWNWKWR